MNKKRMAIVLGAVIFAVCIVAGAIAISGNPEISVGKIMGKPGETVKVDVVVKENPGILGATLKLSFDEDDLTLTKAENGEAFNVLTMTPPGNFNSPCNFVWDGQDISENEIKNGTILSLTFKINENVEVGKELGVNLSYDKGDIVDRDLSALNPSIVNGSITVIGGQTTDMIGAIQSATIQNDKATVVIESQNDIDKAYLVFAEYDDNGVLIQTKIQEVAIKKGNNTFSQDLESSEGHVKVYVLDPNNNPITPSKDVTEETEEEETGTIISVGKIQAHAGDQNVTVNVSVKNNPGILGATLKLTYSDILTLTGCSNGSAFSMLTMTKPGKLESPCNFVWDGVEISGSDIKDGDILTLTFNVKSNVSTGTYPVELSFSNGDIIDGDLNPVDATIHNGSVQIVN